MLTRIRVLSASRWLCCTGCKRCQRCKSQTGQTPWNTCGIHIAMLSISQACLVRTRVCLALPRNQEGGNRLRTHGQSSQVYWARSATAPLDSLTGFFGRLTLRVPEVCRFICHDLEYATCHCSGTARSDAIARQCRASGQGVLGGENRKADREEEALCQDKSRDQSAHAP